MRIWYEKRLDCNARAHFQSELLLRSECSDSSTVDVWECGCTWDEVELDVQAESRPRVLLTGGRRLRWTDTSSSAVAGQLGNNDAALQSWPVTPGETATPPCRDGRCRRARGTDEVAPAAFSRASTSTEAPPRGRSGRPLPGYVLDDADRGKSSTSSTLTRSTRWNDIRCCCRCCSCALLSSMLRLYACVSVFYFFLLGTPVPCHLA